MPQPRMIRKRISSVRNINKITSTMERVAQSRTMKLTSRLIGPPTPEMLDRLRRQAVDTFLGGVLETTT